MKKSRFTEQQIAFALQQAETGTPVEERRLTKRQGVHCIALKGEGSALIYGSKHQE